MPPIVSQFWHAMSERDSNPLIAVQKRAGKANVTHKAAQLRKTVTIYMNWRTGDAPLDRKNFIKFINNNYL